jgi:flagellar protein FliJ
MKFKFKLEKVLLHRQILENVAQKDFKEVQAALDLEIEKLKSFKNDLSTAREKCFRRQSQTGGQVSEELKQIQDFIKLQDIRIERQIKVVETCEKLVEAKREILRQKAMDTKILKRLEEKKKQQFNVEQRVEEQKELDEHSNLRFDLIRKQKGV